MQSLLPAKITGRTPQWSDTLVLPVTEAFLFQGNWSDSLVRGIGDRPQMGWLWGDGGSPGPIYRPEALGRKRFLPVGQTVYNNIDKAAHST